MRIFLGTLLLLSALVAACSSDEKAPTSAVTASTSPLEATGAIPTPLVLPTKTPEPTTTLPPPTSVTAVPQAMAGRLAYIQSGDLWVLSGGKSRQLTTSGDVLAPRWSTSGDWLLFQRGSADKAGLWVIRQDGSGERQLQAQGTYTTGSYGHNAGWSPREDVLAFTLANGGLVSENADGSGRRELLGPMPGPVVTPAWSLAQWSPDGQWLAFVEASGQPPLPVLGVFHLTTGEQKQLFHVTTSDDCIDLRGWSGDSAYVLFDAMTCSASLRADGLELRAVPLAAPDKTISGPRRCSTTTSSRPPARRWRSAPAAAARPGPANLSGSWTWP